jgi:uncharacterized membrane protein (UPF0182 family)
MPESDESKFAFPLSDQSLMIAALVRNHPVALEILVQALMLDLKNVEFLRTRYQVWEGLSDPTRELMRKITVFFLIADDSDITSEVTILLEQLTQNQRLFLWHMMFRAAQTGWSIQG